MVGGRERIDSVLAGIREVRPEADLIGVHDGARPLVPQQVLEAVVERAAETGAAAPALPVTDTVKRAREGLTEETVDRSELWTVQTPQVYKPGWADFFLRHGHSVYLIDEPRRGEAGATGKAGTMTTTPSDQTWYTLWRWPCC